MQRTLLQSLIAWKNKPGRKPLLLKGARQVGKTYLLECFGKSQFSQTTTINFEEHKALHDLFDKDLDPNRIIMELSLHIGRSIDIHTELVIFDEIQACPNALTSLKYFNEKLPALALCAAGSLLGVHMSIGSFPVGQVDLLDLTPMTFMEFLRALDEDLLLDVLVHHDYHTELPEMAHQRLWQWWKHYLITGGLPEVIATYIDHRDDLNTAFREVREKQAALIKSYHSDIAKHSGKVNAMHITRCWEQAAIQLCSNHDEKAARFRFKGIMPSIDRYTRLTNVIDWLLSANLVIKTPIVHMAEQPLKAYTKESLFKLFPFDIGLLGELLGLAPKTIYDYSFGTFKAYFAENFVAQSLENTYSQVLYSWQENKAEVEFLCQYQQYVIPVEVKAGLKVRAKSLQMFIKKYQPPIAIIFSGRNIHFDKNNKILNCPIYCASELPSILSQYISIEEFGEGS